ncbi:hypothetical protein PMAYCL1PPCAC_02973, partial [Pristionchus mayeri]
SLLPSTLSIPSVPKGSPLDIHINVDVAESSFEFSNELLTLDCVVTLAWIDRDNPYLPKKEDVITHYEGELNWIMEIQFSDMWIPPIKRSMEEDEYRGASTKMSEVTFWKNGSVELQFFYTALIPCVQSSLMYPWDEFNCAMYITNLESRDIYTLSPYNREQSFNISYSRPMTHHRISKYNSIISSSFVRSKDRMFRTHGVQFECTVERAQSRVIYSNVIPSLSLIFFDAYIYITDQSPLYCLLVIIPLLVQIQFFAALLVNKVPYLVILLVARTTLSIITSLTRILLIILSKHYPHHVKRFTQYDSPLSRLMFVSISTILVFCI